MRAASLFHPAFEGYKFCFICHDLHDPETLKGAVWRKFFVIYPVDKLILCKILPDFEKFGSETGCLDPLDSPGSIPDGQSSLMHMCSSVRNYIWCYVSV